MARVDVYDLGPVGVHPKQEVVSIPTANVLLQRPETTQPEAITIEANAELFVGIPITWLLRVDLGTEAEETQKLYTVPANHKLRVIGTHMYVNTGVASSEVEIIRDTAPIIVTFDTSANDSESVGEWDLGAYTRVGNPTDRTLLAEGETLNVKHSGGTSRPQYMLRVDALLIASEGNNT